jgi:hypothetical protein
MRTYCRKSKQTQKSSADPPLRQQHTIESTTKVIQKKNIYIVALTILSKMSQPSKQQPQLSMSGDLSGRSSVRRMENKNHPHTNGGGDVTAITGSLKATSMAGSDPVNHYMLMVMVTTVPIVIFMLPPQPPPLIIPRRRHRRL